MFEKIRNGRTSVRSFAFGRILLIGFVLATFFRITVFQVYQVSSESMQPTFMVGDRIGVWKLASDYQNGDLVVVDGYGSFTFTTDSSISTVFGRLVGFEQLESQYFVKRIIGVGGDQVRCCTAAGELEVNGVALTEPYLVGPASAEKFDVVVPAGHVWLMGDNRANSLDSRDLLGRPGGGMISESKIVGRVNAILWPTARMRVLESKE